MVQLRLVCLWTRFNPPFTYECGSDQRCGVDEDPFWENFGLWSVGRMWATVLQCSMRPSCRAYQLLVFVNCQDVQCLMFALSFSFHFNILFNHNTPVYVAFTCMFWTFLSTSLGFIEQSFQRFDTISYKILLTDVDEGLIEFLKNILRTVYCKLICVSTR